MGAADTGVFEVRVPSRMEALADVQSLVDQASQAFGLDEELSHWIELSVNESAINAIQHGNQLDATKDVLLCCCATPGGLRKKR